jgi:YD repeat-containing protein
VYDANARLRFLVSAEGRVTENRYGSPTAGYGLLTQTLLYIGQLYDVTGLGSAQQLTEAELEDWAAGLPDATQVQLTEYSYDLRGNMSQQTSYATVSAAGGGVLDGQASVAEYVYDAHCRLRRRIAVRGSARDRRAVITSFAYDGLTRVLDSSGANGGLTTVYDDANRRITVTGQSGLTETRDFDSRGRLVHVSLAGDGMTRQTRYVYDNADRLRMAEDAQRGRRYRFYDAAGRLEFNVDATGAVTRFEHSTAGQLVRQTQYLNRADTATWYDSASGMVTKDALTVGGAGSDVTAVAAHDRVTSFDYDGAGRLTASTDAAGTVTAIVYDGLSRVVMTQTGDRVTRYLYDKDNRRAGIVDALGYFTEYRYDAAGRLVETVRYSQRSPAAANMTAPVWVGVTQQTIVGGRPFEYRVPAYDADGDTLTFSVVGAAPAWLSFDAGTATLRGTPPAAAGSDSITVRADDGRGRTSDVTVRFTAIPAAPATGGAGAGPAWGPLSSLDIVADAPVSHVVPAAAGPSVTYSVVGGLPPGLSFDAATRTITGTSGAVGFFSIVLRATGGGGQSADRTLSVRIRTAAATPAQPAGSDQPSDWRPADTSGLRSYLFYDGQGRVVGTVDEQQFLTETVYDDALNTERMLRYLAPVTVAPGDTLSSLRSHAGLARQLSLIQFDDFGRVHEVTALDGSTVTRNEYNEAGRVTRVASAANTEEERARRTFYNAYGEVTAVLGGEGDAWLGTDPTPQRIDEAIRDYGIRYEYDTLGRMVRSVDANDNRTLFYYDRENRRTHTVSVIGQAADNSLAGEVSETAYNSFGQPQAVRRYAVRLGDADMGRLLADGGGGPADQVLVGKLAALADANLDQVGRYEYDRAGRVVRQVDGEGDFTESVYNAYGELAAQLRSTREGQTTTKQFDYDLAGRLVSQTADVGGINANSRTDYDAFGRVARSVDGAGRVTTTTYPDNGRSTVVTDPLQRATRTDYDALGRAYRVTNALGLQTVYAYDEAARSATATTPEGRQATTTRTRHGETQSVTDGRGNVTRYGFNRDGQPTAVTDAFGRLTAQSNYDRSGRRLEVTDARGTVTRFGYDQRNRVVEQRVDPAGLNLTTLFAFDALGQQAAVTQGAGTPARRVTTYGYDRKGRTSTVVVDGAAGGLQLCTTTGYDGLDNVVAVARGTAADPNQHVTLYEFDSLGRRVKEIAAPAAVFGVGAPGTRDLTTHYRYDAAGRLARRIDANGQSTWQVYDAAGQMTHGISALGEVSESRYDAVGRLIYSHRYLERLGTGAVTAFGDVVTAFAVPAATGNDQRSHVVYDGDGQPRFSLKASGAAGWVVAENRPDANGNIVEIRAHDRFLPDARVAALDSASSPGITVAEIQNELVALGYRDDDPTTLAGVPRTFLAYDASNRQRFLVDPSGSVTESVYDAAGTVTATVRFAVRPTLAEHGEAAIDAAVDSDDAGNRVTRYVRDAANRLRYTIDALGSVSGNEYDGRGNVVTTVRWATRPALTQYTEGAVDQVTWMVYDTADRLRFTIDATGAVDESTYDATGNIVVTTRFARRPTLASFTEAAVAAAVGPLRSDLENQVSRFAYDAGKRLRFAVDTLGSITESAYDATGNLVSTIRFAARPAVVQADAAALAAAVAPLQADPGNRVTRFAYDAAGRLRFTVDGLGSVSERVYDAVGNLTGTVRFAVRPPLAQYSEGTIDAAMAPHRGHPGNRLEHHLYDALGRLRISVLGLSQDAGQSRYRITAQERNALGQAVGTATYATAAALPAVSEEAIAAAVGAGDPSRDRITRFVYDLAGRPIFRVQAVSVEADRRKYRVSAQRFDALGQGIGSTDYAAVVALDLVDKASVDAAVQAVADQARDRVSAVAYDALGQPIYSVLALGPGGHQVVAQEHDALGRVIRTTQYASAVGPLASFDRTTIETAANAVASASDQMTRYVYDAAGRQRFVLRADKTGRWTVGESRYDAIGNLIESRRYDRYLTDAWIVGLDPARPLGLREEDVAGQLAALGYTDSASASLAGIQRTHFAYDTQNRLRFTVDGLGSIAENVYNALGDRATTIRFAARPTPAQYTENAIDASVDRNDAANRVQHAVYDALGQVRFNVQVIEPDTGTGGRHGITESRYDALGQLMDTRAYATPVGHLNSYDEQVIAAAVVADSAHDRHAVVVHDEGGRPVYGLCGLRVGPGDQYVVTRQQYDALGQLVKRVERASPVAVTSFDAAGVESALAPDSANDRVTTYVHDAAGRLRFQIRPDRTVRESVYDALDQLVETRQFDITFPSHDPAAEADMAAVRGSRAVGDGVTRGLVHVYDAAGRCVQITDAAGLAERHEYDALGSRVRSTDRNGQVWRYVYDRAGQVSVQTTPPAAFALSGEDVTVAPPERVIETRFQYDAFQNLVSRTEAANFDTDAATTQFHYDTVGRPTGTVLPGHYDPATGTVERDPAPGRFRRESSIRYDELGDIVRIGSRRTEDAADYTYRTYDARGQIVHEVNALGHVTRYTANAFGEQETVTRYSLTLTGTPQEETHWTVAEVEAQLNLGHDELGNLLEDVYARTIRTAYDTLGRKSAVTLPEATYYSTQTPGDPSHVDGFRLTPQSVTGVQDAGTTTYEYNAFGDLTRQRVRANTVVEWQDTSFSYDVMGRRTRSMDAAGNVTELSYDTAGNLVLHSEPTDEPGTDRTAQYSYDVLDRQTRVDRYRLRYTDAAGEHGVTWTPDNGGTWLDPDGDVATTVRTTGYDPHGRPVTVTDAAGNVVTMRYDPLGRIVEVAGSARTIAPIGANGEDAVDPFRDQLTTPLVTSMTLDAFGRAVRQVRATAQGQDAREIRQAYDHGGNLVNATDAEGNAKHQAFDAAGRVIRQTQPLRAELGPLGVNEQGLERRYHYDAIGQITSTLDVYLDGSDPVQSGKSVLYNAFGEVSEEHRSWGAADQPPEALNSARSAWYDYNNAGHVFEKVAADGLTLYYYNLLGQVTREEKRGNSNPADGTGSRVTEYQYDVLGRPTMVRRPVFNADVTPGTDITVRPVTPYSLRRLDRWGNAVGTEEGGYEFVNGQVSFPQFRIFVSNQYDSNDRLVAEYLGTYGSTGANGVPTNVLLSRRTFRDLLGNAIQERDEAREPQTEEVLSSRTRRKEYDPTGAVTAEIDATGRRLEFAYNVHGERLGTRNAHATVLFNRYDRTGNIRFHGVLRTSSLAGEGEYDSRTGTGTIVRTYLNAYLYDQAGRRVASKTFTEEADQPWSYTWLDGRNLGVRHCDVMGVVTGQRFDPFGNKSVEIDGAGVRWEWTAATADYAVGRIETYRQPGDNGVKFGRYTYNDFGELKLNALGNASTEYDRHKNGLVALVTIRPDVTQSTVPEMTAYKYDVRGQLTSEGRFDSDSLQTRIISYDTQGRLSRVEDQNKAPGGPICDVRYAYDEWSNVRRIQAIYTPTAADGPMASDSWYAYDKADRLTVSNGALSQGTIGLKRHTPGSVQISYDEVGRRSSTTEYVRHGTALLHGILRNWDTMRDERYEYDDLGHLRRIEQRIRHVNIVEEGHGPTGEPLPKPDRVGSWQPLSTRTANLRGDVTTAEQWTRISGTLNNIQVDQVPSRLGTTTTVYRADGQVIRTKFDAVDPTKSTKTQNTYNAQTGQLDSYIFKAFQSDGTPFTTTFDYRYTLQNGNPVVRRISDLGNGLDTIKAYDPLGRLSSERVELPKPNGAGSDRYEERLYEYGADGRAIYKETRMRLSASGPGTEPLPTPSTGEQTYVYAGERLAATVGALSLAGATKFEFVYTPMSEASGNGSSRYVVQNGDSLIDIAHSSYGDGALWYVIADANGITSDPGEPLPSTEVGKAYDVPDVVRSSHAAGTHVPFGISQVIGNDRPIAIPPPLLPRPSDVELMAVAVASLTLQIGATVILTDLGVLAPIAYGIGGGLGNLGSQITSWALGIQGPGQHGVNWGGVGAAAAEGLVFSAIAGKSRPAGALSREVWHQASSGAWRSGGGLNWTAIAGSVMAVGADVLGPVLAAGEDARVTDGGPTYGAFNASVAGLINSAFNPSTGWAVPGSGRRPVVGAFEFAYGAAANGLANLGYRRIRQLLERPTAPPAAPAPHSVDDLGPIDPKQLDEWDQRDREQVQREDEEALAAANTRIAAASNERIGWLLQTDAMADRIAHFGEDLNDRALIAAARRQMNAKRIEHQRAVARAARQARQRASARLDAQISAPVVDPRLAEQI